MNGYDLHPAVLTDLDEIWEYIAEDDIDAADRVIAEIFDSIRALIPSRNRVSRDLISPPVHSDSRSCTLI
jgi:plasmid stabilization system protein ParE